MKAPLRVLVFSLLMLAPFATASAQTPALSPLPDVTVNAGSTVTLNVVAVDEGGGEIALSSSLPSFATLNSPRIGIGQVVTSLIITPADINVGTYTAAVTATAGGVSDTQLFEIIVAPAGSASAPLISSPALREVAFDSNLSFTVEVTDPDGGGIQTLAASMLPGSAAFVPDASNTTGSFSWTPGTADAGEYDVVFTATATNGLSASSITHVRVTGPPVLMIEPIDDVTVEGGSFISVPVDASGLPGATINLTASLPSFATLNPPGSGTGSVSTTISVSPPTGSAGTYRASVTATSDGEFVTELFDIIVTGDGGPENNPPVLIAPVSTTAAAGSTVSFIVTAVDPDGDPVDLFGSALPPGSSFVDNGNDTGTFTWDTLPGQEGTYLASFSGFDNRGGTGAASTEITVTGDPAENRPPTLVAPATQQVVEGALLSFTVTASDPDGDPVALSADAVPLGADFVDQGDDTALFTWTPTPDQSGVYEVAFTGNDGRGGIGTASTIITVDDAGGPVSCVISGDLEICNGETTRLCGPEGAVRHAWAGPNGFVADTPCIDVSVEGLYELTVTDATGMSSTCFVTVTVSGCDIRNCPRGPGFWMAQCAQRGNGSTKFDRAQMDQITSCVDESSDFFAWSSDFEEFCSTVNPPKPMDIRKQTLRMYAVLLANVCAGELGLVTSNGEVVSLDPTTRISAADDIEGADTVADLIFEAETKLAEMEGLPLTPEVKSAYGRLKDALEDLSEGEGIGPTCKKDDDDRGKDDCDDDHGNGDCKDERRKDDGDKGRERECDGRYGDEDCDEGDSGVDTDDASEQGRAAIGLNPVVRPNPLNPNTELSFYLARDGRVRITIYDVQGRLVKTLMDETRGSGEQRVRWDGKNQNERTVPSGVYFIRIQTPEGEATQRATVLK
jgi:hypothetical protein